MRILAIHSNGVISGGADVVFIKGTSLLAKRGHEIAWVTMGPCPAADEFGHPHYNLSSLSQVNASRNYRIVKGLLYSAESRQMIKRAISEFAPDVAHVHMIKGTLSPSILLELKQRGIPVIQTLHDYHLLCPAVSFLSANKICEDCKGKRYYYCLLHRCGRGRSIAKSSFLCLSSYMFEYWYRYDQLISGYIAPSEFLRQKMIEFGYMPEKITTLHNAYFGHADPPQLLPREHILFTGRLSQEKGADLLVRAAEGLDALVLIAGDGPERSTLETMAREIGAENVKFLGFLPPTLVGELFNRATVSVLPSRCYENGPLVILESFAKVTPVVGTNIGAVPEFIKEGLTGYLFRVNDADDLRTVLLRCLENRAELQHLGQNARQYVLDNHSPQKYVEGLENVLKSVCNAT